MDAEQHVRFYEEVKADIAELEQKLKELRAVANYHAIKARISRPEEGAGATHSMVGTRSGSQRPSNRYAGMRQIQAAKALLLVAGEPLRTAEIARRLIAGGFPAKDPAKLKTSLFTSMTRKQETFRKAGPGLWTLVSESSDE